MSEWIWKISGINIQIKYMVYTTRLIAGLLLFFLYSSLMNSQNLPVELVNPPREFSVMPFWFWNDDLRDDEIIRQISDFEAHGVYGFVIHPRIGLPESIGWLSPKMIQSMRTAIEEAARRKMFVILYDEGMYPSGSSSGQVVARNPDHAAHGLAKIDLKPGETFQLPADSKLITFVDRPGGNRAAIIEKPSGGNIRGLHYIGEGTEKLREESPQAGDILNPDAVTSFIELVYDRYAKEFGSFFGKTILGIFTDEPSPLGRGGTRGIVPGNANLINQINRILGYDFKPYLADLWFTDDNNWAKHRADYNMAVNICLEENYYQRLSDWCKLHGISLMGHPAGSMDIGAEKYFQIPGQDLVWRYVEPGPKALEGQHSTMAKCASSAMVHLGLRRNTNELYGAYGHNLTWKEMSWLANWCFVRGQNFLIPHAFYYSIRGPRFDERPPDVGPNASWWPEFKPFADACRRLSWINSDSRQICSVAILGDPAYLPYQAAKVCFQNQIDFNYLELNLLLEKALVRPDGVHIGGMVYNAIILDSLTSLPENLIPVLKKINASHRLIIQNNSDYRAMFTGASIYKSGEELMPILAKLIKPDITLAPASTNIRLRHVVKGSCDYYILFNEENSEVTTTISASIKKSGQLFNPYTAEISNFKPDQQIEFKPYELKVIIIYQ
jgi:hypothetical protein